MKIIVKRIKSNDKATMSSVYIDDGYTVPDYAEVLASGHCDSDCPFMKLAGEALDKYNLAYPRPFITTQAHEEDGIFYVESYYQAPFKFGVIQ